MLFIEFLSLTPISCAENSNVLIAYCKTHRQMSYTSMLYILFYVSVNKLFYKKHCKFHFSPSTPAARPSNIHLTCICGSAAMSALKRVLDGFFLELYMFIIVITDNNSAVRQHKHNFIPILSFTSMFFDDINKVNNPFFFFFIQRV